jgi:hypothetical protein
MSLGLDNCNPAAWALRDIKRKRLKLTPVDPNDLRTLIDTGFVEIQEDVPVVTRCGTPRGGNRRLRRPRNFAYLDGLALRAPWGMWCTHSAKTSPLATRRRLFGRGGPSGDPHPAKCCKLALGDFALTVAGCYCAIFVLFFAQPFSFWFSMAVGPSHRRQHRLAVLRLVGGNDRSNCYVGKTTQFRVGNPKGTDEADQPAAAR